MDEAGHPFCTRVTSEMKQAQMKVINYFEETYNIKAQKLSLKQMYYSADIFLANMATVPAKKFTTLMSGNGKDINIYFELIKWCLRVSKHTLPCLIYAIVEKVNSSVPKEKRNRFLAMTEELKKTLEDLLGEDGIFLYPPHPETAIYIHQPVFKSHNFVYAAIFNAVGLPVTSCPLGLNSRGLPLGVQIVGSLNNDLLTITVAEELEKVFGGWRNPNL
ncbi:fatty-acid amide hydrolase 2-like [Centruroides sculpturatus]|uniref:fatty-acid amide hydrolase 2-like n=1 Tax=Centruroides sculpturatus TaxID=218467 RepID=UPI000C6DFCF7|nr:fatty-acid amide hydrolase 2-like [Centruroides sculpturatus]